MKAFTTTLSLTTAIEAVSLIQERDHIALANGWLTGWTSSLERMIALRRDADGQFTLAIRGFTESFNFWREVQYRLGLPEAHPEGEEINIPEYKDIVDILFVDYLSTDSVLRPSPGILASQLDPIFGFQVEREMFSRSEVESVLWLYFTEEVHSKEGGYAALQSIVRDRGECLRDLEVRIDDAKVSLAEALDGLPAKAVRPPVRKSPEEVAAEKAVAEAPAEDKPKRVRKPHAPKPAEA